MALNTPDPAQTLPSPNQPYDVAAVFLVQKYANSTCQLTLCWWRNSWMVWRGSHWQELTQSSLRAQLYHFTALATYFGANKETHAWAPTKKKISDLAEALASLCELPDRTEPPCWLDGRVTGPMVAVANGLLDVTSRQLYAHTPLFFNINAVPWAYDAAAPEPRQWLAFLDSTWALPVAAAGADATSTHPAQDLLQEWFGYVLSGRTDFQKMLVMNGPTRGGRGTIGRVLTALLGDINVAGLTLDDLGETFGMEHLVDKSLAIIGDERFSGKNMSMVVSRLLMITGEDRVPVKRKYRGVRDGSLPARLMLFSNELQKLSDASAAIIGRCLLLRMTVSWLGREDIGLLDRLLKELPGILNWALEGLQWLVTNGKFTIDPEADDLLEHMKALASPMHSYVEEQCYVERSYKVRCAVLYYDHSQWRKANGHKGIASNTFGVQLRAAFPDVTRKRMPLQKDGTQPWVYAGIRLKRLQDDMVDDPADSVVLPFAPRVTRDPN